jgi:ABC-2 type transport system ATP-binding protein
MSTIIETRELSKWFGEVIALNNLTLTIEKGVTGLLGPNGAGKSTFIKLALGLYTTSRGTIKILGAPPRNNFDVLRKIAYCPETDSSFDCMTGYEFVYWLNRYSGMTAKSAHIAAERTCELVAMTERMHDPITEYSKGMRQRVKIAQALGTEAELLFLDEPMAGLDPVGREEMFALVRRLGDEGYSVIISSHILHEIERVTQNIVLLYNGTVLAHGTVHEIRNLLDDYPHAITVECDNPQALAAHFTSDSAMIGIDFTPDALTFRTRDANRCYQKLNDLFVQPNINIQSIRCPDDNLQSVFEYLTK